MGTLNEIIKKTIVVGFLVCSLIVSIPSSYAAGSNEAESLRTLEEMGGRIGMPVIKKSETVGGENLLNSKTKWGVTLNTQSGLNTLSRFISELIKYVAILAMMAITWGGIMYITAYGDEKKVTVAKNILLYSLLAVVLSIAAYAIIDIINNISLG